MIKVFPIGYSDKHFVNSNPENQHFDLGTEREKWSNFRTITVLKDKTVSPMKLPYFSKIRVSTFYNPLR